MTKSLKIKIKDLLNPTELARELLSLGYENIGVSTPEKEGQFGKRGNLVDIWLERYKMPVRVDLIDEKIENIYLFNPLTQSTIRRLQEIYVVPFGITPKIVPAWFKKAKFPAGSGKYERLFLSEVKVGDLVVHIDHGIGKFVGISAGPVSSKTPAPQSVSGLTEIPSSPGPFLAATHKDDERLLAPRSLSEAGVPMVVRKSDNLPEFNGQYLLIEYAKGDKLSVPVEQIDRITKYIGAAGYRPKLNSLGTASWEKIKTKVQEGVADVAKNLVSLYAKRELVTRPKFSVDTPWQRQMEEAFEFTETADQIKATAEIKGDLESNQPMDRILVGDVGFGKTEVAMRAAFKVVQDSRQVVVLVPTTLLAEQHYHVFKKRFSQFPVLIEILSRFRSSDEQKKILENVRKGNTDIVIGTHRLLSADVSFKNLGLLVIDEEHRFGVMHKEKLKELKANIDVLAMSATPIPRSLHMALTKLRDISTLGEPPIGRQAIETRVLQFDEQQVKDSIVQEISRSGQVYYLHNNVATIAKKATEVARLVPGAKVVFAHGQMSGQELEKVMGEFYSGKANVLVCTTIIGSGIDMPSVNTIIIEDAQNFGLADLYQLRGRVGRSDKKAYAYMFYPKNYAPKGDVLERLLAIKSADELGSGYKIAKKDLEIRGAGNLLGKAQSGNIALVGFELYIQLLNQTVEEMKGRENALLSHPN